VVRDVPSHGTGPEIRTMTQQALDEAEWLPWLRLSLSAGVGRIRAGKLLDCYGSPEGVFERTPRDLVEQVGLPLPIAKNLLDPARESEARGELARLRTLGVSLAHLRGAGYPELLKETYFPPVVLGSLGPLGDPGRRAVAIVGSRKAGVRSLRIAHDFARQMAEAGVVVVSGLAKGIDRAAHEGALAAKDGRTVAILGNGLARVYPSEHARLAARIRERGALLSEFPSDAGPRADHFPVRNRVIAGMSLGVVLIGAGDPSGALITAEHAEQCGDQREIFAVPGPLDDPYSRGCNRLIKLCRAHLVEGASDVLLTLALVAPKPNVDERPPLAPRAAREPLTGVPADIESYLEASGRFCTFDEIVFDNRIDARAAMSALGFLALRRRVREVPGVGYAFADL